MYIDTHCHLELMDASGSHDAIARAREAGVTAIVTVGIDLASSAEAVQTASYNEGVYAAVGIHPNNAIEATEHVLRHLASLAGHPKVVGIGETGLDWFREGAPPVRQEDSFRDHIRMAKELDKALIIHDRDAHDDVLRLLDEEESPARVVMHCFSGDAGFARACLERGFWLSFAGTVTFKNAEPLREALRRTPLDKVLVETDAPYLTPMPHRGQPNASYLVPLTLRSMAQTLEVEVADLCRAVDRNTDAAFGGPWLPAA